MSRPKKAATGGEIRSRSRFREPERSDFPWDAHPTGARGSDFPWDVHPAGACHSGSVARRSGLPWDVHPTGSRPCESVPRRSDFPWGVHPTGARQSGSVARRFDFPWGAHPMGARRSERVARHSDSPSDRHPTGARGSDFPWDERPTGAAHFARRHPHIQGLSRHSDCDGERDTRRSLAGARRRMRPGGILAVLSPDLRRDTALRWMPVTALCPRGRGRPRATRGEPTPATRGACARRQGWPRGRRSRRSPP